MLFVQYCETRDDIEWVYKNGDKGQQYFSIVYVDGIQHQWLFYVDYIVMKKDRTVWVIETKGGESRCILTYFAHDNSNPPEIYLSNFGGNCYVRLY